LYAGDSASAEFSEIESSHPCKWVMPPLWMCHFTRVNESCHTRKWVMSRFWMSPVTHDFCEQLLNLSSCPRDFINESCPTCVTWLTRCNTLQHTATQLLNLSSSCWSALESSCMNSLYHSYEWHDQFICVTALVHTCDMAHSYAWHDSFICVTWLIHTCDMTHSYAWHASIPRQRILQMLCSIHMCDMTLPLMCHDALAVWQAWVRLVSS